MAIAAENFAKNRERKIEKLYVYFYKIGLFWGSSRRRKKISHRSVLSDLSTEAKNHRHSRAFAHVWQGYTRIPFKYLPDPFSLRGSKRVSRMISSIKKVHIKHTRGASRSKNVRISIQNYQIPFRMNVSC